MTTTEAAFRAEALARRTSSDLIDLPDGQFLGIAEVADRLGLSPHTIRYYERAGLVEVRRDAAGRRAFDTRSVRRIEFVRRMRNSGMGVAQWARYIELVNEGPSTEPQRLDMMVEHREDVRAQLHELQLALAAIDYKITTYGGALDGECSAHRPHLGGEDHDYTA